MFANLFNTFNKNPQAYTPFTLKPLPSKALIDRGDAALETPWPVLTATDYLDFTRTGNRVRFEKKYFDRRHLLNDLVMAEIASREEKYLDAIINGLWSICEESGWQLPSHNSHIRNTPQLPLPNPIQPVLDLFACETGAQLALVYMLLGESLGGEITDRILYEINHRIITPYLTKHFWWMGSGDEPMMNWTPWCTQNALICVAITPQSDKTRRQICEKAAYSLDCFVKDYGDDGCCDEGAKYYGHAALCLYVSMEMLNGMTDNHFAPLYQEPKIRNMADFIRQMHVVDNYYINFADCPPLLDPPGVLAYLFGKRTRNPDLAAFAAVGCNPISTDLSLYTRLAAIISADEIAMHHKNPTPPQDIFFPSVGLMIARDDRFCLAVKAGDNDDNHNHNDTGSFTLYMDGKPFIVDVGVGTYTKDTFSDQRYSIWTMQSAFHNLPTFSGIMQAPGADYKATDVEFTTMPERTCLSMNIAKAYPKEAGVERYFRTVCLERGRGVIITDEYTGEHPVVLSLMLKSKPDIDGQILTMEGKGKIICDKATNIDVEHISITDPLLHKVWSDSLYRVLIGFDRKLQAVIVA
ncbi:MAG: heparinase II/III-family protein [Defluviitaleaceae bacterium]|nr:heparinase II/III-family protein [Defluviitaleaceae bacterium]